VLLIFAWPDYKTNTDIAKKLNITTVLDQMEDYRRNWIQHVNRMPCDRLLKIIINIGPKGRRNKGRPLKRLLNV
jgi:hypothetical protein